MKLANKKNTRLKYITLGIILVFSVVFFACGILQTSSHVPVLGSGHQAKCSASLFTANFSSLKSALVLILGLLIISLKHLLSWVALRIAVLLKLKVSLARNTIKTASVIPKLFYWLLQTFRRGILHPQTYNSLLLSLN